MTVFHSVLSFGFDGLAYSFVGDLPRVQALAFEPSFLAFYLVPAFYLSFATAQHSSTGAILAGVIASTSRAGLVGLGVGGVALLLLAWRAVVKKLMICGAAATVAVGAQVIVSKGAYTGFVSSTVDVNDQASVGPRLATWSTAWDVFLQHPLNGVGIGAYGGGVHELGIALGTPDSAIKTTNLWLEVLSRARPNRTRFARRLARDRTRRPVATPGRATGGVRRRSNRGLRRDVRVRADVVGALPLDHLDPRLQRRLPSRRHTFALASRRA